MRCAAWWGDFEIKGVTLRSRNLILTAFVIAHWMLTAGDAMAQTTPANAVTEAAALRDRGSFAESVRLLEGYLKDHPDDGDAARMLAQTLYWLKDVRVATAHYETALRQHPEDSSLRLDYGRMLVETRRDRYAVEILTPLLNDSQRRAAAESLLGTLNYWQGDLAEAERHFESALRTDSTQVEARRQLREIYSLTAPWVRAAGSGRSDDQPLTRGGVLLEAGWFPDPAVKILARAEPMFFQLGDTASRSVTAGQATVAVSVPSLRLQAEVGGGGIWRSYGGSDWTGVAALTIHPVQDISTSARYERAAYLYTLASLSAPVMAQTFSGVLHLDDPRGWLGEAAAQRESYPDDNAVNTAYAWLLAPALNEPSFLIQLGYAYAYENANASRFVLAQSPPPIGPPVSFNGRYDPYYTPSNIVSHSAIAAVTAKVAPTTWLHVNGAYSFHATQDAPSFSLVTTGGVGPRVERQFQQTNFVPWNLRASLSSSASNGVGVEASGEYSKNAFYSSFVFTAGITYRFTSAAIRKADRF